MAVYFTGKLIPTSQLLSITVTSMYVTFGLANLQASYLQRGLEPSSFFVDIR